MDEQEQRIKIAEACGWDCDPEVAREWLTRGQHCIAPSNVPMRWPYKEGDTVSKHTIPGYLNDLNACNEMEKTLDPLELTKYKERMRLFYGQAAVFATAKQRCEAFLKVLSLWVDE